MDKLWEVYALKYAERDDRVRSESFIFDSDYLSKHPMDYFVWVLSCICSSIQFLIKLLETTSGTYVFVANFGDMSAQGIFNSVL